VDAVTGRLARFGEQHRDEVGSVFRQLEDRLVHQLQIEIAAADVENDGILGLIAAM
jgi:hypothetical protein